jgi:perosamine synthetase
MGHNHSHRSEPAVAQERRVYAQQDRSRAPRSVAMSAPDIEQQDIDAVVEVLRSKQLSLGPCIERFEHLFADYCGAAHAIAVSSGTAGLHLCVRAAGLGPGDEVITTPFSFVASANCMLYERAIPRFVDIDETSLNIDPALAAAAVTERTRALLPVHVFGQPCAMDELEEIRHRAGLMLIEDACEAVGAEYRGRKVGTFGEAAVFGFYPNKQITLGEGGIITTNDADWAAKLRSLRNQGRSEMGTWLHHESLGFNYRLDEMSAALGVSQLSRIEDLLKRRSRRAAAYAERLRQVPGVTLVSRVATTTRMSWFVLVVRMDPRIAKNAVIEDLRNNGIPTRTYFSPIHLQPFYRKAFDYNEGDFPVTERVAKTTLALPFHSNISDDDIEYVVACLKAAVERFGA